MEEHQMNGAWEMRCKVLARFNPTLRDGSHDSFGESGTPTQLLAKYGLGPENIVQAVEKS
jgi:transketolase